MPGPVVSMMTIFRHVNGGLSSRSHISRTCRRLVRSLLKLGSAIAPDRLDLPETTGNGTLGVDQASDPGDDTALSALRLALQALCAISRSVPLPGIHLPFDALLTILDKVKTAYQNHQGFHGLAVRLQTLHGIILEIDNARNPPVELLGSLKQELETLRNDIQRAMSNNKLERFINSTEDASSLTAHDNTLRIIISSLSLAVSVRTSVKVDEVTEKLNNISAGVTRIEARSASHRVRLSQPVFLCTDSTMSRPLSQSFRGAKIDTRRLGTSIGGRIGSENYGLKSQDFVEVDFTTGGGAVGSGNRFVG